MSNLYLQERNWTKFLVSKKRNRPLSIINASFTYSNVFVRNKLCRVYCPTLTSTIAEHKNSAIGKHFKSTPMNISLRFLRNARTNLTVLFMKCSLLEWRKVTPYAQRFIWLLSVIILFVSFLNVFLVLIPYDYIFILKYVIPILILTW